MTGAVALVIPLSVGVVTGHPSGGAAVGLGAWLVASRAILDPAGVSRPFMLGVVASLAVGTALGIFVSGESWLIVPAASALGGLGVLVRPIGITPALTLLLTAANPLPLDPPQHTGLQVLGGLLAAVLLTLPWPWRRTRPLAVTLSRAAEALADLVEAGADPGHDPGDWEALRNKAGDALDNAQVMCSRHRWQRRSRAGEQVVSTLRRVFYEVVALHGLADALRERAPAAGERAGLRELAASVALALRSFIGEEPVPDPLPAFEARVNELRADRPHGERELLVLVLLRQIGHCAERIRRALTDNRQAAHRLHSTRYELPALPVRPVVPPGFRSSLAFDNPRVRHALRVLLGTAFASTIIEVFHPPHPHWLVIAVLVTLQPTYGETRARMWARIGGSTAGGLVTAGILHFAPGQAWLVLLIGVSAALAFGMASVHQAYWSTFMTMCVLLLIDFQLPGGTAVVESRIVLTIVGGLIAIACTRLLWPRGETVRLADRVAHMLSTHAEAARALAGMTRGKTPADKAELKITKAELAADAVAQALTYIAHEPGGTAPGAAQKAVEAAQRVRDDLMSLTAVSRGEAVPALPEPGVPDSGVHEPAARAPAGTGHVPDVLDAVAKRLTYAAEAVQTGEPFAPRGDVDRELAVVSASVGCLAERRLAELDADPSDTRTEVRRALLRTTALDQALRSLGPDTLELCDAAASAFATPEPEAVMA
ncbi:hypothetical protein Pth03_20770 [Planotetraspora thailandica]|uniref:Integral membrane bound transporter domain-containing protein n=1 Tax=Planotetraspora thailandica TaxID=487172 RepID=A0A8J3XY02_9ACTN|nr:FUSC family protein [Planotetraspora thailandica]GII53688.1 hypothetical protein Pth03_20770 [Planotetraspora thailandica]